MPDGGNLSELRFPHDGAARARLEALSRAADAVELALAAAASEIADRQLSKTIDALERELVLRGVRTREPALFDDLLLATQIERELEALTERAGTGGGE